MYDFYANPPKTKQNIRDYLTSWLEKPEPAPPLLNIGKETYVQELGFRRAFHMHGVYRNTTTNEYVWWVFEYPDIEKFPVERFSDFEKMLNHVIDDYYLAWKLNQ